MKALATVIVKRMKAIIEQKNQLMTGYYNLNNRMIKGQKNVSPVILLFFYSLQHMCVTKKSK